MSEAEDIFTSKEMSDISGVTGTHACKWVRAGLINKKLHGKGWQKNVWSLDDIFGMRLIRLLKAWSFSQDEIRGVLRTLRRANRFLFVTINDGKKVLTWDRKKQKERTAEAETVFCVNLDQVWRQVKRKSAELLADRLKMDDEEFGRIMGRKEKAK